MNYAKFIFVACLFCHASVAAEAAIKPKPILKPLYICAHRAGGRVFAPDNSLPNMEHAMRRLGALGRLGTGFLWLPFRA